MTYLFVKSLHVIAIIAWMAGLLYLPRLFVYHAGAAQGSEMSETFKVMERRLLKFIMNPAMIVSWILGLWLAMGLGAVDMSTDFWFHAKLTLVIVMTVFHMALGKWRKGFETDQNTHSARFYRFMNEVPTVLMIAIVLLVIMKPF